MLVNIVKYKFMTSQSAVAGSGYPNFKHLLHFSFGFFVVMFAFFSAATVYSKILKDKGYGSLGFYGLGILYCAMSLTSLAAPSIAALMRCQRVIQLGTLAFTIWMLTGIVASIDGVNEGLVTFAVIIGSLCSGSGAAIFWMA